MYEGNYIHLTSDVCIFFTGIIIIGTIETLVPRCLDVSYFEDYGLIFFQCNLGTCKYIQWRLMIKLKNQ